MAAGKNRKYDWDKLYEEWLHGDYVSITEFGKKQGIPLNTIYSYARKYKWVEKKTQYNTRKAQEITTSIIINSKEKAIEYNNKAIKQCDCANDVITKYMEAVAKSGKFSVFTFEKIITCMERLQKIQRIALGLDKQGVNSAAEDNVASIMSALREVIDDDRKGD